MSRRSSFVLIAIVAAAVTGAVAVHSGGGRLRQWLLALHGVPPKHASSRPRRAAGSPPAAWPQTNAGQVARRWVEAFSSGEDAMRQVLAQDLAAESLAQRGIEERLGTYRSLHQRFATLTLESVDASNDGELKVTLLAPDGSLQDFSFEVQPDPPYKLSSVRFLETQTRPHPH